MFGYDQDIVGPVPWAELIRARTADQVQRAVLVAVSRGAARIGVAPVRAELQRAAGAAMARLELGGREAGGQEMAGAELLGLAADYEGTCPPTIDEIIAAILRHHGYPPPPPPPEWLTAEEVSMVAAMSRFADAAGLKGVAEVARGAVENSAG
ncbi:hypothetical protein [Microbacterium candidum]|uniref:Uncharacterized protein n=1 Tax=Microbacterium candidum TaxID=3041922 RepID=A0ABT7MVU8_9MICO|nr:hypothetical protein [Microbacterium sp. ASV49]MDL9978538.1 hypothetical protein [Microbacterium sp. ASV49]